MGNRTATRGTSRKLILSSPLRPVLQLSIAARLVSGLQHTWQHQNYCNGLIELLPLRLDMNKSVLISKVMNLGHCNHSPNFLAYAVFRTYIAQSSAGLATTTGVPLLYVAFIATFHAFTCASIINTPIKLMFSSALY